MIIHLIYTAMYAILVVSLLISYDLFIKNFKELNLRLSFKILIGIVLFISQVYFIISFSLNSIGYVAYEYTIPIFIYYWSSNGSKADITKGYGVQTTTMSKVKRAVFTRITNPENFDMAKTISSYNKQEFLDAMNGKRNGTVEEMKKYAGID